MFYERTTTMKENIIQKIVDNQDKVTAVELDGVHYKVDFISDVTTYPNIFLNPSLL